MSDDQRITMDITKSLWREVGIKAAVDGETKRAIVEMALERFLKED